MREMLFGSFVNLKLANHFHLCSGKLNQVNTAIVGITIQMIVKINIDDLMIYY